MANANREKKIEAKENWRKRNEIFFMPNEVQCGVMMAMVVEGNEYFQNLTKEEKNQ